MKFKNRLDIQDELSVVDVYPTETAGDGLIRDNNLISGSQQGAGSKKLKVKCKQCGFFPDLNRDNSSGGTLAQEDLTITKTTNTITLKGGFTYTENVGERVIPRGYGCPVCGSRNYSNVSKSPRAL